MIPGSFAYHRPKSAQEAVKLLAELGEEARPLAGGHSLIPMMKLRLARPAHLVDLGRIGDLKGIRDDGGEIVIGAMTTQHELIASDRLASGLPIIREAALLIADPQVRYQGTLGGNVANGDPGNDMPALMQCLDATYHLLGRGGERRVKAREFYQGAYFTALEPGEIVTAVRIPLPPAGHGWAYEKLKRKVGDYATAAVALLLTMQGGKCKTAAIGLTNLGETPLFAADAAAALVGSDLGDAALAKAAAAAEAQVAPASDGRGPVEYRRKMAGVMLRRAVLSAKARVV
ncbi:MAG: FAD binding domain-containing protein [Pseudomonadota bacterium]